MVSWSSVPSPKAVDVVGGDSAAVCAAVNDSSTRCSAGVRLQSGPPRPIVRPHDHHASTLVSAARTDAGRPLRVAC